MINCGVIGCGYWGPNIIRNLYEMDDVRPVSCCDIRPHRLQFIKKRYPLVDATLDYKEMLDNPDIDAVVIATPAFTHFQIAKEAFSKGKHVLIEKPMTRTSLEAKKLIELARKKDRVLMVDHIFIYSPAVQKIKEIITKGELGDIYYFDSVRINLGLFQHDVNVVWDLAPHDIAIMDYLLNRRPKSVSAIGSCHIGNCIENTAYLHIKYGNNLIAHIHVNWLAPVKIRTTLIGGSRKMVVYNEIEPSEKVRVYSKGVDIRNDPDGRRKTLIDYRTGDMYAPKIEHKEALGNVCAHFIDCIAKGKEPITGGEAGLRVVEILEAAQRSIKNGGRAIQL